MSRSEVPAAAAAAGLDIIVEFGGGLEVLFTGAKRLALSLPGDVRTLGELVRWLAGPSGLLLARERVSLFSRPGDAGGVRPGILVLANDADWELEGGAARPLRAGDVIAFISTLHGG